MQTASLRPSRLDFGIQTDIGFGIQKRGGHLYEISTRILRGWGMDIFGSDIRSKSQEDKRELSWMKLPWNRIRTARLLMCRIEDILDNVAARALDLGIVSSDVLRKWQLAEGETLKRKKFTVIKDLGPAGSSMRLGVSGDFLRVWLGRTREEGDENIKVLAYWKKIVEECYRQNRPIITSDKATFTNFLQENGLNFNPGNILERKGTIEAQGSLMSAPLICDLVNSGQTMRRNFYIPVENLEVVPSSRVLLIGNKPKLKPPYESAYRARLEAYEGLVKAANTGISPT